MSSSKMLQLERHRAPDATAKIPTRFESISIEMDSRLELRQQLLFIDIGQFSSPTSPVRKFQITIFAG